MSDKTLWLLTNINVDKTKNYTLEKFDNYSIQYSNSNNNWIVDGYVNFRNDFQTKSENLFQNLEKIGNTNAEIGRKVKGNFTIIHFDKNGFEIYSDHFGIKKYFIWRQGDKFMIGNDLSEISKHVSLVPSSENMAGYSLTYHFTGGKTAFKNLSHNQPAEKITFENDILRSENYWNPKELLEIEKQNISIDIISNKLSHTVKSNIEKIDLDIISLSLTGGADTRNLLAIFLNEGIKPHIYTYGNSESSDCQMALKITKGLGLEHSVYHIQMTSDVFEKMARKIIRLSGGLASIHRVHRLMAVEREKAFANYMFLGTLGGEFIKGVSEDAYIVPEIVYDNWDVDSFDEEWLNHYFINKRLSADTIDMEKFLEFLRNEPYMNGKKIVRKHQSLIYITAHLHDAQDINLYDTVMKKVYTPFLDIDYLELLFSSFHTFDVKEQKKNKYLKRFENPVYGSKFLEATYPPLLDYKYSGEHIPKEVMNNKYIAAVKKIIRQKKGDKYPPNFPLGQWMSDFVKDQLPMCKDYSSINEVFKIDKLIEDFHSETHIPVESYWLKYTNPIMMRMIIEEYSS